MLLEQEGVSPEKPGTRYGRTLLSWASKGRNKSVVKAFLKQSYCCPVTLDNKNQNPISLALSLKNNVELRGFEWGATILIPALLIMMEWPSPALRWTY